MVLVEGSMLSPCCSWPATEVLKREEMVVQLCRQHSESPKAIRLQVAQGFAASAAQLLPRSPVCVAVNVA